MVKWFCLVSFLFVFSTVQPSTTDKREIIRYSDSVLSSRGFRTPTSKPQPVLHSGWEPCRDKGECFSGAWFGQSQHITFSPDLGDFNSSKRAQLMKRVYCEDASNWFFHKMFRHKAPNYAWGDMPAQSIDVFDFSGFPSILCTVLILMTVCLQYFICLLPRDFCKRTLQPDQTNGKK